MLKFLILRFVHQPIMVALFISVFAIILSGCAASTGASAKQIETGKQVYEQQCMSCHGVNGVGQYPDAPNKRDVQGLIGAPPHNSNGHTWHHADALLFSITKNGHVAPGFHPMPAFGDKLKDEEIWAVLAYIKTWWTPEQLKQQAAVSAQYTPRAIQIK